MWQKLDYRYCLHIDYKNTWNDKQTNLKKNSEANNNILWLLKNVNYDIFIEGTLQYYAYFMFGLKVLIITKWSSY